MKDSISITFPGNKAVKRVSNEPFARSIAKVARAMKRIFVPDTKTSLNRIGLFSPNTPAIVFMFELFGWTVQQCLDLQTYNAKIKHMSLEEPPLKHVDLGKYL